MKSTRVLFAGVLVLATVAMGALVVRAENQPSREGASAENVAFTMGEIGRRAHYGLDGNFMTTATRGGSLVITSQNDDAGHWTATMISPPVLPYTVQVRVRSHIQPAAGRAVGAGVVFGLQRRTENKGAKFYAALVTSGTLYVYEHTDDGGFAQLVKSSGSRASGGFDTLRVTVRKDGFSVSLNENGSVSQSVGDPLTGEFGVFVSGAGSATFRDLILQ
jgi:hypothetical protein